MNAYFAKEVMKYQPISEDPSVTKNTMRYRGLDGFVAAVSPFNFTAIGGNLAYTPALMVCYDYSELFALCIVCLSPPVLVPVLVISCRNYDILVYCTVCSECTSSPYCSFWEVLLHYTPILI